MFTRKANEQAYAPVRDDAGDNDDETLASTHEDAPFSWLEYSVFLLLGVAMLWAWYVSNSL